MLYYKFINRNISKSLLCIYFCLQCISAIINFTILPVLVFILLIILTLGGTNIKSIYQLIFVLLIFFIIIIIYTLIYVCIPINALIATKKIINKGQLNKYQKYSTIIFPITTIPFYLVMIYFNDIPQILLVFLKMLLCTINNNAQFCQF